MSDTGPSIEYDVDLYVEACSHIQTLTCPECKSEFNEYVSKRTAGASCPECNAMIEFVHDRNRGEDRESVSETTKQATLTGSCQ